MIGDVYDLRFMRWKVSSVFDDNGKACARLHCLDQKMNPWVVPLPFLEVVVDRKVSAGKG